MKSCYTCKQYTNHSEDIPCVGCITHTNYPHWKPNDDLADIIEEAERKAFKSARELHPTKFAYRKYETFEEWKKTET